eukprot:1494564-Amphidinium_carterae.2
MLEWIRPAPEHAGMRGVRPSCADSVAGDKDLSYCASYPTYPWSPVRRNTAGHDLNSILPLPLPFVLLPSPPPKHD